MDDATIGMIGGIAGCVIGVGGGLFGTYCSIKRAKTPAARKFTIRLSLYVWGLVSTLLVFQFALPDPYGFLMWLPYGIALALLIRWGARQEALIGAASEVAKEPVDEV